MKYFLAIFVTAVLAFLGATLYYKSFPVFPGYNKSLISTESGVPVAETPTPMATSSAGTLVTSGGILVFNKYSIVVPSGWQYLKEGAPSGDIQIDKLIITKNNLNITIYQAATGGAICLYLGDPDTEAPSSRFTAFVDLNTQSGNKLRRSLSASGYTFCEKTGDNPWGQPTSFGHISVTSTATFSDNDLKEIDSIVSSLKKI